MEQKSDADDLARRLLDLWQDQVVALCDDPDLRDHLDRFLGPSAWQALSRRTMETSSLGPNSGIDRGADRTPEAESQEAGRQEKGTPRPSAASAAPERGDRRLEQLEARLAALEERLDQLASGLEGESLTSRP